MRKVVLEQVSFKYPDESLDVFNNINLKIQANDFGKIISIVGPSGCGKTTLIKLLDRELLPFRGRIEFENFKNVTFLPQNPVLFEHLTVFDNAYLFNRITSKKQFFNETLLKKTAQRLNFPEEYLNNKTSVNQLSGGEKQKLALIRSFSIDPNAIIMDEPCNSIDTVHKTEFLLELKRIVHEFKTLAIYVSHDISEVNLIADEVIFFDKYSPTQTYDGTNLIHSNINQLTQTPTTIDTLKFFKTDYVNVFSCIVNGDDLRVNSVILKIGDSNSLPSDEYLFYFSPYEIHFLTMKSANSFNVKDVYFTENSEYSILIENDTKEKVLFRKEYHTYEEHKYFSIKGEVYLLNIRNQKMYKTILK